VLKTSRGFFKKVSLVFLDICLFFLLHVGIKVVSVISPKVDIKTWLPIFDVIVSDYALKFFVFGTRIPKSN